MRVFEYGCGFSTLWFSSNVKEIISVDHDKTWVTRLKKSNLKNSIVVYKETPSSYASAIKDYGLFDIILIDGVERRLCFENACGSLNENGIIIWDNSDRHEFFQIRAELIALGFKVIDFPGLAPSRFTPTQTSIIYRANNCLGI
jgi:predicted O-methyltransferase YrrM